MSNARTFLSLTFAGLLLTAASADASILTFDMTGVSSDLGLGATNYGDHIASLGPVVDGPHSYSYDKGNGFTPSVALDYSATHSTSSTTTGVFRRATFGNSAILLTSNTDNTVLLNRKFYLTFTPDHDDVPLRLNSFQLMDVGGFQTASQTVTWTVYKTSVSPLNILATDTVTWADGGSVLVNIGLNFVKSTVILELRHDAGPRQDLYIDNVNFDIPEPASVGALIIGVVATTARRSRKPR